MHLNCARGLAISMMTSIPWHNGIYSMFAVTSSSGGYKLSSKASIFSGFFGDDFCSMLFLCGDFHAANHNIHMLYF